MPQITPDILENDILRRWPEVLRALLKDHTTNRNIFWATDMYEKEYGESYSFRHQITVEQITGDNGTIIRPRAVKSIEEQRYRIKDKAEVFTPSWICNAQNNLVDDAWFGRENVFNTLDEKTHEWIPTEGKIEFPENRTWQEYVCSNRLEITCGEAPYLVSRYDTTTGKPFAELNMRVGLLDRKLRVVGENVGEIVFFDNIPFRNKDADHKYVKEQLASFGIEGAMIEKFFNKNFHYTKVQIPEHAEWRPSTTIIQKARQLERNTMEFGGNFLIMNVKSME